MTNGQLLSTKTLAADMTAGLVVFLVALPLCLGVALASGAPLVSGLIAGILGGILVGSLSGSHTSVSGPAAGLTSIVAAQIAGLGSFENFLLAVMFAGVLQIFLGLLQAGQLASFAPSSVIKGLLAAIGIILILKQIPHIFGHDTDPEGDMAFAQPDQENTLSELMTLVAGQIHFGAAAIGLTSIAVMLFWERSKVLKMTRIPAPLAVVLFGLGLSYWFASFGPPWAIGRSHRVQVPIMANFGELSKFITFPDFSAWSNPAIYKGAIVIALVASLETLLNLEAVDRLDPQRRNSPPNRELLAQGVGNVAAGLLGAIPVTSVVVRSSVNINSGGKTKLATIIHGILLVVCVLFLPRLLNQIPISCLAAILLVTGFKLASPKLFKQMWADGRYQFLPFIITVLAIVFSDLLIGVLIGLTISLGFILNSNLRRPLRTVREKHLGGDVLRVELANQVSFLNRAAVDGVLNRLKAGDQVLLDASHTDYIDPDVLGLIREFTSSSAPARNIQVSLVGFREKYAFKDEIQYIDYSTRELQDELSPQGVLQILLDGNERFRKNKTLRRDVNRQLSAAASGQHPLAVILSCIDSRTPSELIFDMGIGDTFSVRVAGNVLSDRVLGSIEYGCRVAGAKLVLVMGHSQCGAVSATVAIAAGPQPPVIPGGCVHLLPIVNDILESVDTKSLKRHAELDADAQLKVVDETARRNAIRSAHGILERSDTIRSLVDEGRVVVVAAIYDVASGKIEMLFSSADS